jgi:2-keto-4-pentenoate hydratase/2-oxohepta-3-ene-1,7-dioic acid hydratase in catechol pathway
MRLATVRPVDSAASDPGVHRVAIVLPSGRFLPLMSLALLMPDRLAEEIEGLDLATVVAIDPRFDVLRETISEAGAKDVDAVSLDPETVRLAPPILRPGKVIGVGYNYLEHVREQGIERPARPVLFSKFANSVIGDGEPIRKPAGTHALDLEAELAVVIGRHASGVEAEEALGYVAGYTAANDVTARDWQGQAKALRPGEKGDGQWLRAKGSDTFCPLGPVFVTADELGDGGNLRVHSWLTAASGPNAGQPFEMQNGTTADLLFSVAELIAIISREVALDPGDVIITGTPSGVGVFREPPIFLEPGDLARVEVEGIGSITNPITDETGAVPEGSPAARFLGALESRPGT